MNELRETSAPPSRSCGSPGFPHESGAIALRLHLGADFTADNTAARRRTLRIVGALRHGPGEAGDAAQLMRREQVCGQLSESMAGCRKRRRRVA
eukprot:scaffold88680_cov39-Phaeocystis_antarctica.AAC.1